jgi:hypothetical protein
MPSVRVAAGPETAKAADQLRQLVERRDQHPFPWVIPPPKSIRRNPWGQIATPALGVQSTVLSFTVPQGYQFDMIGVILAAISTGMSLIGNPGDFLFTISRNLPTSGTVPLQGSPLADFQQIPFALGQPWFMPFLLPRSENFGPTDIIRANVLNVSGAVGAPNYAVAMFTGWLRKA